MERNSSGHARVGRREKGGEEGGGGREKLSLLESRERTNLHLAGLGVENPPLSCCSQRKEPAVVVL